MRVIVVVATNAATRKKNTGNTRAMASMRSAYCSKVTKLTVELRSSTYHSPLLIWLTCSSASFSWARPSASCCSASAFRLSYSARESASCCTPSLYCCQPSSSRVRAASNWV